MFGSLEEILASYVRIILCEHFAMNLIDVHIYSYNNQSFS